MSVLVTQVNSDNVAELPDEPHRFYYLVSVDWEYTSSRYVFAHSQPDAIAIDFTPRVLEMPKDEGFVITGVQAL